MSNRFAWLIGLLVLILIGFSVACGNSYNSLSNGLVLVGSQGSGLLETFSFSLSGGNNIPLLNSPLNTDLLSCVLPGVPSSIVLDPAGAYLYAILNQNPACPGSVTGIQAFKVTSGGMLTAAGSLVPDPSPVALSMDTAGKFLFVLEGVRSTSGVLQVTQCANSTEVGACSYAIGSGGALTPVPGTFTFIPPVGFQTPNFTAAAPTPTVLPPLQNGQTTAVCANPSNTAATTEYLYVTDATNYAVWEFGVDTSTGALTNPPGHSSVPSFAAGAVPSGVAVDACNRFVYVTDMQSNQISGYYICNGITSQSSQCPPPVDGRLFPVSGSPFSLTTGSGPGPLVIDPFGNYVYVLNTLSFTVLPFQISKVSGSLTAGKPVNTALQTTSTTGGAPSANNGQIAVRGDDSWLFVTNYNSASISQYSIIPATGALQALPAITTDDYPYGVAVK